MNHEKYNDPTAERAIAAADKWEQKQKELEEKHGIKRGDTIWIVVTSYSANGEVVRNKIRTKVKALYPHLVELKLPNGLTRSPTYWELERMKTGGGTDGQENTGAVH